MTRAWGEELQDRLESLSQRIAQAAERSHRPPDSVTVVAITKGRPVEAIQASVDLGLDQIGENRVEEARQKQGLLKGALIHWHMVGHIQSRKAIDVPGHFAWIHSVDRMKIANRLNRIALERGVRPLVLLECNVSGEASKGGWLLEDQQSWRGVKQEFQTMIDLKGLKVVGLMTMAPWVQDEEILRKTFRTLRDLRDYLSHELGHSLPELSMGMTDDYEIAIEEGATMVRLGRALFGPA